MKAGTNLKEPQLHPHIYFSLTWSLLWLSISPLILVICNCWAALRLHKKRLASASGARPVLPPPGVGGDLRSNCHLIPSRAPSTHRMLNLFFCLRKNPFLWKLPDSLGGAWWGMGLGFWTGEGNLQGWQYWIFQQFLYFLPATTIHYA